MIQITHESAITLADVAKCIPPGRGGKKTHLSTIVRWIRHGVRDPNGKRVRLEAVRIGGRWLTTEEAVDRFCSRLTPEYSGDVDSEAHPFRQSGSKASDLAGEALDQLGI